MSDLEEEKVRILYVKVPTVMVVCKEENTLMLFTMIPTSEMVIANTGVTDRVTLASKEEVEDFRASKNSMFKDIFEMFDKDKGKEERK